ncbi:potassium transporter Kup [Sphingomonas aquatilis]|uniref:potassium transporter Kup n=1 Tax=Sphingomonas aquatilis TaxID=93063 RepID=UPI0023F9A66E|nr:potassium transporter Kup [Sphingomonas aquatilis]MCI4655117.1 potassium transporter Kup [Sphingomonas aquatilis]
MTATSTPAVVAEPSHHSDSTSKLALGALGVVFGDIGTSPLYALKESFAGHRPLPVDQVHIFGVLSLMIWTMILIVTIKYVFIILRADNHGEGGSLALLALITGTLKDKAWMPAVIMLGIFAAALFYGDAIITPAISVLSAVEGLGAVSDQFSHYVIPIAVVILIGLFLIQSHGTARVGAFFGPVMALYFVALAVLGVINIADKPGILAALNPWWALNFFALDFPLAFLALGSVVLAVTGAEALYADMGHFGRKPISIAWLYAVFPCLLINYMGQGALLLSQPGAIEAPFFLLAPEWARLPLVILATMATIIASQAVISGAFSVTQQAVQLGFLPRLRILHTSARAAGQIYVPLVNWLLLGFVLALVVGFKSSSNLAAAYGIAVTGTMFITACMLGVLTHTVWRWPTWASFTVTGVFLFIDAMFFASTLTKIPDGGWFPLLVAGIVFVLLTTWKTGRKLMHARLEDSAMSLELFAKSAAPSLTRVPGTAVFLSSSREAVPPALLHNVKHNKVLHERNIVVTVVIERVPHIAANSRLELIRIDDTIHRAILRYGFMDEVDLPEALRTCHGWEPPLKPMDTSFFLGRQTLIASELPGMAIWREKLFAWMQRNAESAMDFFRLPTNRVVELGSQVEI